MCGDFGAGRDDTRLGASLVFTPLGGIWYRLIVGLETLQATSLHVSFCRSAVVLSEQPPSGVIAGFVKRCSYWTHQD